MDVKLKEQLVQISGTSMIPQEVKRICSDTYTQLRPRRSCERSSPPAERRFYGAVGNKVNISPGEREQGSSGVDVWTGAAVSILETHAKVANPVRGLARMIQVSPKLSIVDLSVYGCSPGRYYASVRENGDISQGAASTGAVWRGTATGEKEEPRGRFGEFEVDESGAGSVFLTRPVEIWELIGRSLVVSKKESGFATNDPDTLCGVIARSAGVWENEKTVRVNSSAALCRKRGEGRGGGERGMAWLFHRMHTRDLSVVSIVLLWLPLPLLLLLLVFLL